MRSREFCHSYKLISSTMRREGRVYVDAEAGDDMIVGR
jgi:hypothetical protein